MNRLFQALTSAADGAFVINDEQHIIYWNQAAQEILGYVSAEVTDQLCYEILAGRDDQGRLICHEHCRMAETALGGRTVTSFDACVNTKANGLRWVNMSTFTFPANNGETGQLLVHFFRDATQKKQQEQFIDQVLAVARDSKIEVSSPAPVSMPVEARTTDLTDREHQVLVLLTQGLNTDDLARSLFISSSTARNHIRNILQKLHVHSRLEAVVYALKRGLVTKE